MSQDPLGFASGEINFYGSRKNNPLKYTDPNGENPALIFGGAILGGAVVQGATSFLTTIAVTHNLDQSFEAAKKGAFAGGVAGLIAVTGSYSALAVGAATVIDLGISLLTGPSALQDSKDFTKGLKSIVSPSTACLPDNTTQSSSKNYSSGSSNYYSTSSTVESPVKPEAPRPSWYHYSYQTDDGRTVTGGSS